MNHSAILVEWKQLMFRKLLTREQRGFDRFSTVWQIRACRDSIKVTEISNAELILISIK